jgi:hypothetical protein
MGGAPGTGGSAGKTGAGGTGMAGGTSSGGTAGIGNAGAGNGGSAGSGMGGASGGTGGGTVDAGAVHLIHCGNTFCTAQKEFCCIPERQTDPSRCVALGSFCVDGSDRIYCDDRSDCTGVGEVCCAADNLSGGASTAACVMPAQCVINVRKAQQLCDPQTPGQCISINMNNPCRLDNNATIPGYAYCH